MTKYAGEEQRETSWHMSKEVTVSTLLAIALAVGGGVSAYTDINSDIKIIQKQVEEATGDRVRKAEVRLMFKNKDVQLEAVKNDIIILQKQSEKIEAKIDRSQELLLEIIRTMPRKEN